MKRKDYKLWSIKNHEQKAEIPSETGSGYDQRYCIQYGW